MRVKRGLTGHRRHKKYLTAAKGFRGGRSRLYRTAREAVERSLQYAYVGRKLRKRDFRTLWILRINAGWVRTMPDSRRNAGSDLCNYTFDRRTGFQCSCYGDW